MSGPLEFYQAIVNTATKNVKAQETAAKAEGLQPVTVVSVMGAAMIVCIIGIVIGAILSSQ